MAMPYGKSYYQIQKEIKEAERMEAGQVKDPQDAGETVLKGTPENTQTDSQPPAEERPAPPEDKEGSAVPEAPLPKEPDREQEQAPSPGIGDHDEDLADFRQSAASAENAVPVLPDDLSGDTPAPETSGTDEDGVFGGIPQDETGQEESVHGDDTDNDDGMMPEAGESGYRQQEKPVPSVRIRKESPCYQRGVPASVAEVARSLFPGVGFEKAITAYIYYKEGCPKEMDVPEDVRAMAIKKKNDGSQLSNSEMQRNLLSKISSMENRMKGMQQSIDMLTFLTAYIQYDRDGFTGERPKTLEGVRFGVPVEYMEKVETGFRNTSSVLNSRKNRRVY